MSYGKYGGYDKSTQTTFAGVIPAGIQENISLINIAIEPMKKDGTGGNVLKFHFQSENGALFTHTEFPINDAQIASRARMEKKNVDDEIRKEYGIQARRIKHILDAFVPEDDNVIDPSTVNSWQKYMERVLEIAGHAYQGRKFRLKIILSSKDFERFPNTPGEGGFILPMESANTLKLNPKYDRIVKKEASTETEVAYANPFADMENAETTVDAEQIGDDTLFAIADESANPADVDDLF